MNNEEIKIYPEMQKRRLLKFIRKTKEDLEQLKLLQDSYTINYVGNIDIMALYEIATEYQELLENPDDKRRNFFEIQWCIRYLLSNSEEYKQHYIGYFSKIPSIYDNIKGKDNFKFISEEQIFAQQKIEIKKFFEKLIKSKSEEESKSLQFVLDQKVVQNKETEQVRAFIYDSVFYDVLSLDQDRELSSLLNIPELFYDILNSDQCQKLLLSVNVSELFYDSLRTKRGLELLSLLNIPELLYDALNSDQAQEFLSSSDVPELLYNLKSKQCQELLSSSSISSEPVYDFLNSKQGQKLLSLLNIPKLLYDALNSDQAQKLLSLLNIPKLFYDFLNSDQDQKDIFIFTNRKRILELVYMVEVGEYIKLKFKNAIDLKTKNQCILEDKLREIKNKIYNNQFKNRPLNVITPNIVIGGLQYNNISKECCCLEYHINDRSLFFDEFKIENSKGQPKCTNLVRNKIEYQLTRQVDKDKQKSNENKGPLIENVLEFYKCVKEIKESSRSFDISAVICHKFFEEKHIKQVLLDNKLADKPDNILVDISCHFNPIDIGFAAIDATEGNKHFIKIIFFQTADENEQPYLHVVECNELSESGKAAFENGRIKRFLERLNYYLFTTLLYDNKEKKKPIDIVKSGTMFRSIENKASSDNSKTKSHDKYLMKYKPFVISDKSKKSDDDIVIQKYFDEYLNKESILENIHTVGSLINTLSGGRMQYCCYDGTEITHNLPTNLFNYYIVKSKFIDDRSRENLDEKNKEAFDKQKEAAILKAMNELTDKSLGIQLQ